MRWLVKLMLSVMVLSWSLNVGVGAVGPIEASPYVPPPELDKSPVIMTGFSFRGGEIGYVQLHNLSDDPVQLDGWKIEYDAGTKTRPLADLTGWIAPNNYLLAGGAELAPGSADFSFVSGSADGSVSLPTRIDTLRVVPSARYASEEIKLVQDKGEYWRRKMSQVTSEYISGYVSFEPDGEPLFGGGFYTYPEAIAVVVSEVLPNPRDCSPVDKSLDCLDYVKLHNPAAEPFDLSGLRLRVGDRLQTATPSNTFQLDGMIQPGEFSVINTDASGEPILLNNSDNYVWLEDTYGISLYENTVMSYANAGSARKGQAWAFDVINGAWKWTTQPTPANTPSVFPADEPSPITAPPSNDLVPCAADEYRNPETNRCRKIEVSQPLESRPCGAGEERNPETNRCRSITSLSATSLPCPAGQYRNPETNRCRSFVVAATAEAPVPCRVGQVRNPDTGRCRLLEIAGDEPAPCKERQERNPETNRCRNVLGAATQAAAYPVEAVAETEAAFAGWWVLGGVGALAAAYGAWEWREEVRTAIVKTRIFFTSGR